MHIQSKLPGLLTCVLCGYGLISAEGQEADYQTGSAYFRALKGHSLATQRAGGYDQIEVTLNNEKIALVGQTTDAAPHGPAVPVHLAVRLWGQLVDSANRPGPFVNLQKHKWQRRERFHLWIETSVPIQLAIFQNYPEGRLPSRQVSPDERYPSTFATIMPGAPYRFPRMLQVDDDLHDEIVSIIAVRADAAVLPCNGAVAAGAAEVTEGNATAVASAMVDTIIDRNDIPPGGHVRIRGRAAAMASTQTQGTLKGIVADQTKSVFQGLNQASQKGPQAKSPRAKLGLVASNPCELIQSQDVDDVDTLMLGVGPVAQMEMIFRKD